MLFQRIRTWAPNLFESIRLDPQTRKLHEITSQSKIDSFSAMRTRFLTDVFNSSTTSQTLYFLRFPPPHLPSPELFKFDNISCFDQANSLNIYPEIDRFSVNKALRKVFSDVVPQYVNSEFDQQIAREVASEEKINEDGAATTNLTLKFETPELCISLEDSCFLHEEKMQVFFEVADAEVSPDLSDFSLEVQKLMDIHKSIFYVEDVCLEIQFEAVSLVKGQISSDLRIFHLLEVDETSLGINNMSEDNHIIFESNELQQLMHKDELTCDSKELLLSVEVDILEHLLNLPSHECQKFEVPCVNFVPLDIINAIENPSSPLLFEQREFFDVSTSHFSQVLFDSEVTSEVEHCELMFRDEAVNTFHDLIVINELILVDDSFKSLPVPIISDHEEIFLVQKLTEEIFPKLKLQPSSTSDDIYLDWHILEEDISSDYLCTSLKMFEDIDTYCTNTDVNSFDCQILTLEFVLSDTCSNEQKTEEKAEVLNIERCRKLTESACHDEIASSETCKKMASGEALVDNKVNRDHQLLQSMTQFDDLDFLLNQATIPVKKQKSVDRKEEMDRVLPVDSANNLYETHDTNKKQHSLENDFHPSGDFHSTSVLNESRKNSGPFHSRRVEEKNSMKSLEKTYEVPKLPLAMKSHKINTSMPSLPEAIVIVNTQNVKTEMVISRRSTYQRILAMEKEGMQVVERDLNQPVDVIINAAVCLVLYDSKNIRERTNSSDGASSLVPSCMENIAANILTSLSFAFSSCIMIFEGEVGFLGGIMESSDELYAAAASLGVDLQLFCSFSPDITDEIILHCIIHKSTRGLYPRMPDSETLAESFLSKFPVLNPLSAHAILSSVGTLKEFFEMSHQQRVCALQKFLVPQASITLFSALCRHGEREESRSGMTDCCSSVSSGHESGNFCPKSDHEQKKRKYIGSTEPKAMSMDPLKTVSSHSFWNLEDQAFDDIKMSNSFSKNQRSDGRMMLNRPSLTETSFGQNKQVDMPIVDKLGRHTNKVEIIDIDDDAVAGEDISFLHPKKLSSDWFSPPIFPTASEINSDLDSWIPTKYNGQSSGEGFILNSHTSLINNVTPFKEKDPRYGRTSLSEAICSDQPQKGSPWTIDFLNRIKEKSRMRHQSLPNTSSAPCFGYSGNSSKFRKRKSPSILNLYMYKNSSTVPSVEHKGQNGPTQPPNSSKAVRAAHSSSHTWTPVDKRAKRKLTFATNGSKGQSKLIWSDKTDQTLNNRL